MNLQKRFEESSTGQTFLSVLFVALIVGVVAWNMPASRLTHEINKHSSPAMQSLGLDQGWGVFAPPREQSIDLRADIQLRDGRQVVWRPPAQGRYIGPYRTYRWWKWVEMIHNDDHRGYWYQIALWIADKYRAYSPVSVTLVRLWRNSTPPGTSITDHWHSYDFYTLQLSGGAR